MPHPRTIIVTGANRGIGHAICQSLLSHPNLSNSPLKLFAASRKGASLDFKISNSSHQVFYPKLDVTSQDSIRDFNKEVEKSGIEGELVLVNNAGVNLDNEYGVENVRRTMDVNYYGTLHMCNTFLPHVKQTKGRIVNLASIASQLKFYSAAIQARFRDASSVSDHESIMKDFISSVESSSEDAAGFGPPARSYSVSKGLVRSLTAILAKENPDVIVNCCCPGWINTEMGNLVASKGRTAPKSGEEGARIPVRLAVGEDLGGVSGGYWANESVRGTGEGQVEEGWS